MSAEKANTILIVEDDRELNNVMSTILKSTGEYEVIQCFDGESALTLIMDENIRPELILCDINLPEISGISFVQQQLAKNLDLNVCFISGDQTSETLLTALQLGVTDYFCKPVDFNEILEKVPRLIQLGAHKIKLLGDEKTDFEVTKTNKIENLYRFINSISKAKDGS
ncbi:MAG: response regulator [Pseudobdellovibrio sp.]